MTDATAERALVPTPATESESSLVARLASAGTALAGLTDPAAIKDVLDRTRAVETYVRRQKLSAEAQFAATALRLRTERRLGELLATMEKHNGDPSSHDVTRLSELGIERMQSHRWQTEAALPESVFEATLEAARADGFREITSAQIYKLGRQHRAASAVATAVPSETHGVVTDLSELAGMRFGCVYADPPWRYDNRSTRGAAEDHYPTMSLEELRALPVRELAADDALLHLWTTNAFIFECPKLFDAWGFEFKSAFVWCKPQMGMGNYWRVSHEYLLTGVRGSLPFSDKSLKSWMELDRSKHSAKPYKVREMVERAGPGPRLELFGREAVEGWTVFGNQVRVGLFSGSKGE